MSLKSKLEKMPFYNDLVLPVHYVQALRAGMKYGWPAKKLRVIGVTGTNGKTTTCFMIWKMLNESGRKAGLLTTVGWGGVGGAPFERISSLESAATQSSHAECASFRCSTLPRTSSQTASPRESSDSSLDATILHRQYEHMTTERVEVLNERMKVVAEAGAEFLVLEVTSHALAQYRTLGVPIEIAVFTNLTHEHLDYHRTFENYRKAKMKLFEKAKCGVVNLDDPNADWFAQAAHLSSSRSTSLSSPVRGSSTLSTAPLRASNSSRISGFQPEKSAIPRKNKQVSSSLENLDFSSKNTACLDLENENENSVASGTVAENVGNNYAAGDIITYGIEQGEVRATDIKLKTDGVEYACGDMRIKTRIPGKFNVYNSLAAVCVGKKLGLSNKEIEDGIYALREVEGRMNRIDEGQKFDVIVDYAHTPDALENVFSSVDSSSERSTSLSSPVRGSSTLSTAPLRASNSPRISSPITSSGVKERRDFADEMATDDSGPEGRGKSKVIVVHGGAGRRDESTRPIRGEILGKYSDIVIITEDDSRDEDPEKIAAQFVEGAEKAGKVLNEDLFVELDRRKAIERALRMAHEGDLVLILGKGHEKTILRADGPHEFEDIKVAKEILKEMEK